MPLYEYACEKCNKVTELIHKVSESGPTRCPHCQGSLRRLISRTSFQLKGTGWYATDYKKSPASSAVKAEPSASTSETTPKKAGGDS